MATSFEEIYEKAIFKIHEYDFLDQNTELNEAILNKFLNSAEVDFQPVCRVNLMDKTDDAYNNDLTQEEQEILALGTAYYWLSSKTIRSDLFKNPIVNSDYTTFSPGNLLKEIQTLRTSVKQEFHGAIKTYSFRHSHLADLKANDKRHRGKGRR